MNINSNEPLKLNESNNKNNNFGKENKNFNEFNKSTKIPVKNNEANASFKMGDFEVKEENIVRPLDIKANNNINNIINNNNKNIVNNESISDFEESFKEENNPKNI